MANGFRCAVLKNHILWVLIFVFFELTWGCHDSASLQTQLENCVQSNKSWTQCQLLTRTQLTIPSHGDGCLILHDEHENVLTKVTVGVKTFAECIETPMYTFGVFKNLEYRQMMHCPLVGNCTGTTCADLRTNDLIPEFAQLSKFPGNSFCMQGTPCFVVSSSCIFYRIFAPISHKFQTFQCSQWRTFAKLNVTISTSNGTQSSELSMDEGSVIETHGLKLRLVNIRHLTEYNFPSNLHFVSDGKLLSYIDGQAKEQSKIVLCNGTSNIDGNDCKVDINACRCWAADDRVVCSCSNQQELQDQIMRNRLPIKYADQFLSVKNGKVMAELSTSVMVQVDSIGAVSTLEHNAQCGVFNATLSGCAKCVEGATLQVRCHANIGNVLGFVKCGNGQYFAITCSPGMEPQDVRWITSKLFERETCVLKCPASESSFTVEGKLHIIDHPDGWDNRHGAEVKPLEYATAFEVFFNFLTVNLYHALLFVFAILVIGILFKCMC